MDEQITNMNLGHVSAYAFAKSKGYDGTEEEFAQACADLGIQVSYLEDMTVTVNILEPGSAASATYEDGTLTLNIPKGDTGDPAPSEEVAPAVNAWLLENISQETGYVLDRTLESSEAAAPADLVGDLKSALNGASDRVNILHQLINYGYEDADFESTTSGTVTRLGVSRRNTQITLNLPSTNATYRLKVSGELKRAATQPDTDAWATGMSLIEGHQYRAKMVYLSGTVTGDNVPTLSVYPVGTHATIGRGQRNGNTYLRNFVASSTAVNLVVYISPSTVLTNAVYNIFLEDVTEELDAEDMRFDINHLLDSSQHDFSADEKLRWGISNNNKWQAIGSTSLTRCYALPITSELSVYVTANEDTNAVIAFLKSFEPVDDATPDYSTGYSSRIDITAGETMRYKVPIDCTYLYVFATTSAGVDATPTLYFGHTKTDSELVEKHVPADAKAVGEILTTQSGTLNGVVESIPKLLGLTNENGSVIHTETDYDTITTPGNYFCQSASDAATMVHCPVNVGHKLIVLATTAISRPFQILLPLSSKNERIWFRVYYNDSFSNWKSTAFQNDIIEYNCENVLQYGSFSSGTNNGVTYTFEKDGTCTISGEATDSSYRNIVGSTSSVPSYIKKGKTYFFNFNGGNIPVRVYYYYSDSSKNKDLTYKSSFALKIPTDLTGILIRFQIASGTVFEEPVTVKYEMISYAKPPLIHDVNIAMLGDSITSGRIGDETTSNRPEETIPQRVANELQVNTTNFGVGSMGWISHEHLATNAYEYIQTLDLSGYNYITLAYGANDSDSYLGTANDTTEETIMGNVYKTCYYLMQNYPTIQIILITPAFGKSGGSFPTWGWGITRGPSDGHWKYADMVEQFEAFSEKYHVPLIRGDKCFTSFNVNAMIGDNVHPTREGYKVLGHYIAGQIRKFL